jgi:hypothetical protein
MVPSKLIPAKDAKPDKPLAFWSDDSIGIKVLPAVYVFGVAKAIKMPINPKANVNLIILTLLIGTYRKDVQLYRFMLQLTTATK